MANAHLNQERKDNQSLRLEIQAYQDLELAMSDEEDVFHDT